jgi:hypothetical protein
MLAVTPAVVFGETPPRPGHAFVACDHPRTLLRSSSLICEWFSCEHFMQGPNVILSLYGSRICKIYVETSPTTRRRHHESDTPVCGVFNGCKRSVTDEVGEHRSSVAAVWRRELKQWPPSCVRHITKMTPTADGWYCGVVQRFGCCCGERRCACGRVIGTAERGAPPGPGGASGAMDACAGSQSESVVSARIMTDPAEPGSPTIVSQRRPCLHSIVSHAAAPPR